MLAACPLPRSVPELAALPEVRSAYAQLHRRHWGPLEAALLHPLYRPCILGLARNFMRRSAMADPRRAAANDAPHIEG